MNETSVNTNVENEGVKRPFYSSRFILTKELFYDFSSVSYHNAKKIFSTFFCLIACLSIVNLYFGNYDQVINCGAWISLLMALLYIVTNRSTKIGYERMLLSEGKEPSFDYALFDDRIVSYHEGLKKEYFYHQITRFFETKSFILLHLGHHMYITVEKSSLNASAEEVKAFLISRYTLVKKKKFINCANDKKWALIFLIALIAVSSVGVVTGLILKARLIL